MDMINTSQDAAFGTMVTYMKAILMDNKFYVN